MSSLPERSAMVFDTFKIRSYALAERFSFSIAAFQEISANCIYHTNFFQHLTGYLCIAINTGVVLISFFLYIPCFYHAVADIGGIFLLFDGGQFTERDGCDFHMQINTVKQGPGNFIQIFLNRSGWAGTFSFRVIIKSARAGIHGGY